jgi:hypothetical protein
MLGKKEEGLLPFERDEGSQIETEEWALGRSFS